MILAIGIGVITVTVITILLIRDRKRNSPTSASDPSYKNAITNSDKKIQLANSAFTLLINANELSEEYMVGSKIEFAYLLVNKYDKIATLFKLITPFREVYYFSVDDNNMLFAIDNTKMNDGIFYVTKKQMHEMYNITDYNENDYIMTVEEE